MCQRRVKVILRISQFVFCLALWFWNPVIILLRYVRRGAAFAQATSKSCCISLEASLRTPTFADCGFLNQAIESSFAIVFRSATVGGGYLDSRRKSQVMLGKNFISCLQRQFLPKIRWIFSFHNRFPHKRFYVMNCFLNSCLFNLENSPPGFRVSKKLLVRKFYSIPLFSMVPWLPSCEGQCQ